MDRYDKFVGIKKYTDSIAEIYGTEDFSIYLYSIVKMRKPNTVLELGTGLGSTSLWTGLALEENNYGEIHTVDNGNQWSEIINNDLFKLRNTTENYKNYISKLIDCYDLNKHIKFHHSNIEDFNISEKIDILFSDFNHGIDSILELLVAYLPKMQDTSLIFIDSASTLFPSYQMLESLVPLLNSKTIPKSILRLFSYRDPIELELFKQVVFNSKFTLTHLFENKYRAQNSTTCIEINPIDIFPNTTSMIRI